MIRNRLISGRLRVGNARGLCLPFQGIDTRVFNLLGHAL